MSNHIFSLFPHQTPPQQTVHNPKKKCFAIKTETRRSHFAIEAIFVAKITFKYIMNEVKKMQKKTKTWRHDVSFVPPLDGVFMFLEDVLSVSLFPSSHPVVCIYLLKFLSIVHIYKVMCVLYTTGQFETKTKFQKQRYWCLYKKKNQTL